jgi:hypothetical protein
MATILLVGTDLPLLEGVAQTLGAMGHQTQLALTLTEAADLASGGSAPLLAVIQRDLAVGNTEALRIPLAPGGTLVLFRTDAEEPTATLGAPLQRAVMADLALPLERHRLIALVHHVVDRARRTGRGPSQTPPEEQAPYKQ